MTFPLYFVNLYIPNILSSIFKKKKKLVKKLGEVKELDYELRGNKKRK